MTVRVLGLEILGTNRETKGRGLQLPVSESSISPNSVFKLHAVEEQGSPAHEHLEAVHRGKGRDSETEKATGQTSRPDFSSARPPPSGKCWVHTKIHALHISSLPLR